MRIGRIINRNKDIIQGLLGNISNIRASVNYDDALKPLKDAEKEGNDYQKFVTLNSKLGNTQIDNKELFNTSENVKDGYQNSKSFTDFSNQTVPVENIKEGYIGSPSHNDYSQMENPTLSYLDYLKQNQEKYTDDFGKFYEKKDVPNQSGSYLDYLKSNQDKYAEDFNNFYEMQHTPISKEDYEKKKFEKSGLTPEEIAFYNEFKAKKFDPKMYNRKLTSLVYDNADNLRSRGSRGDELLKDLSNKASSLLMDTTVPEPKYQAVGDGKVLKITPGSGYEIIDTNDKNKDVEKEKKAIREKIGFRIMPEIGEDGNETGKYWFESPTANGWERSELEATPEQYKAWKNKLEKAGMSLDDELDVRDGHKTGRTSSRRRSSTGTVGLKLPNTIEDAKKMKPEDIEKMDLKYTKDLNTLKTIVDNKLGIYSADVVKAAKEKIKSYKGKNSSLLDDSDLEGDGEDTPTEDLTSRTMKKVNSPEFQKQIKDKAERSNDIEIQRTSAAKQLQLLKSSFESGKYYGPELIQKAKEYLDDITEAGYDEEVIKEVEDLINSYIAGTKR